MYKIVKLLKFLVLMILVTSHNLPEYMEHGFVCADTEDMEPTSSEFFQKGNNTFSVRVWLPNGRKCYFNWETLARIVISHPWKKIMGFSIQARKGPDFRRRIGMMIKITDATTHCDELGAITHKSYKPRSQVQVQWARLGAPLTKKMMFRVIIIDEQKWYSANVTLENCHLANECGSNPCKNNGKCLDGLAFYACVCQPGFRGYRCEDVDECSSNPCKNGGVCLDFVNKYTCSCQPSFFGLHCENRNECSSNPCKNGGKCWDQNNKYTCTCLNGYYGDQCEYYNECIGASICANGATCTDTLESFKCMCAPGWTGQTCTDDFKECASHPCQNQATCLEGKNMYTCECFIGYYGVHCESRICNAMIENNTKFHAKKNVIRYEHVKTVEECCEICKHRLSCFAFTLDQEQESCELVFHEKPERVTTPDGSSFISGLMQDICWYMGNHTVDPDAPLTPFHTKNDVKHKEACCSLCFTDPRCKSFLWEMEECRRYNSNIVNVKANRKPNSTIGFPYR